MSTKSEEKGLPMDFSAKVIAKLTFTICKIFVRRRMNNPAQRHFPLSEWATVFSFPTMKLTHSCLNYTRIRHSAQDSSRGIQ
jgi:hypothetical protein